MSRFVLRNAFLIGALTFTIVGCGGRDPIALFKHKHPDEAKTYSLLSPIDLEILVWCTSSSSILIVSKDLKKEFSNVPGVVQFADNLRDKTMGELDKKNAFLHECEVIVSAGGIICQYRFNTSDEHGFRQDIGILLIDKTGDIVKRDLWLSNYGAKSN